MLIAAAAIAAVITNTDDVRACLPLADGAVLVGTSGGLVRGDHVVTASDGLPGTRIDDIVADADGKHAWIATDAGIAEVDVQTLAIARAVTGKPVRDVARLGDTVYVATWDGGVVTLGGGDAPLPMHGGTTAARLRVSALAVTGGTLYAGTTAGLYALRGGTLDRVTDAPSGIVSLAIDPSDGALWLATPDGAYRRDRGGHVAKIGGGDVRRVTIVAGALALAGDGGLQAVDRGRVVALAGAPKLGLAEALAGVAGGAACAGGLDGLWTRASATATWQHAAPRGGLPSNDIAALAADGDTLWVGTFDHGLATLRDGRWTTIDAPGLDPRIDAIVVAPDAVWIGTADGLFALAHDDPRRVVARVTRHDGLPGRSVLSLARLADGRIVAGSSSGAALIDPATGRASRIGPKGVGNVWAIAETADHALWLGATTGLYRGAATAWSSKDGDASGDDGDGGDGAWKRFSVASGALRDDWVTAISARGDTVWVGTYKGGVTRISGDRALALGDGWVNPNGISWDGERMIVATMDGVRIGDGESASWSTIANLPGRDTTAIARIDHAVWVATRRGLARESH